MNLQKKTVSIGIALLIFIPIWLFLIVPELEKIDDDYERNFDLFYTINEKFDIEGEWTGESIAKAFIKLKSSNLGSDALVIESFYRAETLEGSLLWEVDPKYTIDRKKRSNLDKEGYFLFPRNVEKKKYNLWPFGYNHNFDLEFKGVERIKELETYHFGFQDEVTDETFGFSFLELVPEVYNARTIQHLDLWVEPLSGIIINWNDGGTSYYVDKTTGDKIEDFYIWTDNFQEDTIASQVRLAQNEKQRIILIERIIPILLALIGTALILASFIGRKFVEEEKKTKTQQGGFLKGFFSKIVEKIKGKKVIPKKNKSTIKKNNKNV